AAASARDADKGDFMALSRAAALGPRIAAFALLALVAGASHGQGRFAISADGQEVTDSTSRLTWRRCAEGMRWDGKTCSGRLVNFGNGKVRGNVGQSKFALRLVRAGA